MAVEVTRHFEKRMASWASQAFEKVVDVDDVNTVVVVL